LLLPLEVLSSGPELFTELLRAFLADGECVDTVFEDSRAIVRLP